MESTVLIHYSGTSPQTSLLTIFDWLLCFTEIVLKWLVYSVFLQHFTLKWVLVAIFGWLAWRWIYYRYDMIKKDDWTWWGLHRTNVIFFFFFFLHLDNKICKSGHLCSTAVFHYDAVLSHIWSFIKTMGDCCDLDIAHSHITLLYFSYILMNYAIT